MSRKQKIQVGIVIALVILLLSQYIHNIICDAVWGVSIDFVYYDDYYGLNYGCTFGEARKDEDYVYYRCRITVKNRNANQKAIKIRGVLLEDYLFRLIDNPCLRIIDEDGEERIFYIAGNSTKEYEDVVFRVPIGEVSEYVKVRRAMPWIFIVATNYAE